MLIDCHSFPSNEADIDICIGYNEDWSKPNDFTLNLVRDTFKNAGYSVVFNKPYSNSISPRAIFYYPSLIYDAEIEVVKNYSTHVLENAMEFNTPKEYAEMLVM